MSKIFSGKPVINHLFDALSNIEYNKDDIVDLINRVPLEDINTKGTIGNTLLITASIKRYDEIIELLVQKGADVDIQNDYGYTALMCTSMLGATPAAESLIEANADINIQCNGGYTALMYTARYNNIDIVRMLLQEENIDIDLHNNSGYTALDVAHIFNNQEITDLLKSYQ